jgi:dCTP diphosphatase
MGIKKMDLNKIQADIDKMIFDRDWDQFHSVKNLSMALSIETAELMEIFQWQTEKQSNEVSKHPQLKLKVADELADIFVYLLRIVKKSDINLEEAVQNKLKKNLEKYPVEKFRGSPKKYNEID